MGDNTEVLVAEARRSTPGTRVGAFFGFYGTLVDGFAMNDISTDLQRRHRFRTWAPARDMEHATSTRDPRRLDASLRTSCEAWAGRAYADMEALGASAFAGQIARQLRSGAWALVKAHLRRGHTVVIVTSAFRFEVAPAATELGIEHILCTELEVDEGGALTGRLLGCRNGGARKAHSVEEFASEHDIDITRSFGYAHAAEDIPFLATVGRPRIINASPGLAAHASTAGWPAYGLGGGAGPSVLGVTRSVMTTVGMLSSLTTGLALGALNRDRRQAVDLSLSLLGDVGTALAGVEVTVDSGAEHLWAHRPAVFVFNHQSDGDMIVLAKLLRGGYTAAAKKELQSVPLIGQYFRLADVAFLDRSNSADAQAALAPLVDRLRSGLSVVIAPEGTRSLSPRVGTFKKGAFHVARQAGVPVVPIVLDGVGKAMGRGLQEIRPGVVRCVVLPPVDVGGWGLADFGPQIDSLQQRYTEILDSWPAPTRKR